jgi:hypothetical protein
MNAYGKAQLRSWATSRHRGTVALRITNETLPVQGPVSAGVTPSKLVQSGMSKQYTLRVDVRKADLPSCPRAGVDSATYGARVYIVDEVQGWENEWSTVVTIRASVSFN